MAEAATSRGAAASTADGATSQDVVDEILSELFDESSSAAPESAPKRLKCAASEEAAKDKAPSSRWMSSLLQQPGRGNPAVAPSRAERASNATSAGKGEGASSAKEGGPKAETVRFNVGGRVFEVLREPTLSLHPECVLNMLDEISGGEPIFVEADPDLFPYILQYLRSRRVRIPITVSTKAVLAEALKLGLAIQENDIERDPLPMDVCWRLLGSSQVDADAALAESTVALEDAYYRVVADVVVKSAMEKLCHTQRLFLSWAKIQKRVFLAPRRELRSHEHQHVLRHLQSLLHAQGLRVEVSGAGVTIELPTPA
mmetsp:Transcript_67983/g.196995  ORF Transcript_67983/g.196995 Transcript_67983/m.196995 type:complete len:314 (+) Transcript_67983:88-1029(+)